MAMQVLEPGAHVHAADRIAPVPVARRDGDRAAIPVQNAAVAKATGMLGKLRSFPYTVDTARPGLAFDDGTHVSIVAVGEIWAPAWTDVVDGLPRSASSNLGLVEAAVMAVRWFIWRVILNDQDKRWRVLVHRTSRRSRRWRVVRVEFFATANDAKARQDEILKGWRQYVRQYGWDDAPGLTASARRALRKGSQARQARRGIGFLVVRSVLIFLVTCVVLFALAVVITAFAT